MLMSRSFNYLTTNCREYFEKISNLGESPTTLFRLTFFFGKSGKRRPNGVQRLYRVCSERNLDGNRTVRPTGRCILAIESLRRVHRHAPGGSHCIVPSDANIHVHCWTLLRDRADERYADIPHGLRKHFHAFSSCIRPTGRGARNVRIAPKCSF